MTSAVPAHATGAIVLDIEGTTTPVSFVYDVLFPYAREKLRPYLRERLDDVDLKRAVALLREEHTNDTSAREPVPDWPETEDNVHVEALGDYLEWLMDRDRKSPGLKLVEGKIWEHGYADGTLHGEVYPDVRPALERWRAAGLTIAIYSSGSVLAQRLLFRHSTSGDLTPFLSHYFDTGVGPKRSSESYRRIATALHLHPDEIVFVSDIAAELTAARETGLHTLLCVRPPGDVLDATDVSVVQTFDDVDARLRLSVSRS